MWFLNIFIYFYKGVRHSFYSLGIISFHLFNYFLYGIFLTFVFIIHCIKLFLIGLISVIIHFSKGIYFVSFKLYSYEKRFFLLFKIKPKPKKVIEKIKNNVPEVKKDKVENILISKNKNVIVKNNTIEKDLHTKIDKKESKKIKEKINKAKEEIKKKSRKDKVPFSKKLSDLYNNLSIVKDYKNQQELKRQVLSIEFDPEATKKSEKRQTYIYEAKNPDGKFIKGTFDAFSKVDVHSFLLNEGYEVYDIRTNSWVNFLYGQSSVGKVKYKSKELEFMLTQLSTYLRSGLPLVESLRIFCKQERKENKQKVLQAIIYELIMGESLSSGLEKQGNTFPRLLINMIKTAELTGELPDTLDDMADYYSVMERTRKQMVSAMTYPSIILVMSMGIIAFLLVFVIPQFEGIYKDIGAELPDITKWVLSASKFLSTNYMYVIMGVILVIGLFIYAYKKIKLFRTVIQYMLMKTPVIGKVIIYNEMTLFTKTFASLLNHNVFITESMEILSKITTNEIYKMIIFDTITNIARGDSISKSFKDHWAFPIVAYEMLITGERTGELGKMMAKVAKFYQEQHSSLVTQLKSFIEPVMISFLAILVGGLLLAVIIPMFSLYSQLGGIYDFTIFNNILHIWNNTRFIL